MHALGLYTRAIIRKPAFLHSHTRARTCATDTLVGRYKGKTCERDALVAIYTDIKVGRTRMHMLHAPARAAEHEEPRAQALVGLFNARRTP